MTFKEQFFRFWKTKNEKLSIIRDVVVALLAVFIVLLLLWGYTGQWFSAPMVAIESGSMEHNNAPFGRLGTIDAGDMVLVVKVYIANDITPHGGPMSGAQAENGHQTYSNYGDVIIYKPMGRTDVSQIIHRAMCWVNVTIIHGIPRYSIPDYGIENQTSLTILELGLHDVSPRWEHSGFLTKGDHNEVIDQISDICPQPVQVDWITGKARGEIPWFGTINLFFEDVLHGRNTIKNVHTDSLQCLGIVIGLLIAIPICLDLYDYLKKKKEQQPPST